MYGRNSRGNASEATGKFSPRARSATEATSSTAKPWRSAARGRNSPRHLEPGSRLNPAAIRLSGRKLDDDFRAASSRRPPGPNVVGHLQHLAPTREKHSIDRKPHEKHVNRPSGPKQQPLPRLQRPPPQQPAQPSQGIVSDRTALANNVALNSPNRNLFHKRSPMDQRRPCAKPGFARRERIQPSRGALNTTRGLA